MTFVAVGTGIRGTATSALVPVPAGTAAGQVAVINMYTQSADVTITFPSGWVIKADTGDTNAASRGRLITAYKRLTGADSGTYTVSWTTSALYSAVCEIHTDIGQNGDPWEAIASIVGTSTATVSFAQTLTTTLAAGSDLVVAATSHATNAGDWTPAPTGMTERFDSFALAGVGNLAVWTQDAVAAGAQSKTTATTGTIGNSYVRGFIGALKAKTVPDAPTFTPGADDVSATLIWAIPTTGDFPTSFDVRLNGGTIVNLGNVFTYTFTGLSNETVYSVEVRGVNAQGNGAWALRNVRTGSATRRYFLDSGSWTPPANILRCAPFGAAGGGGGGIGFSGGGGGGAGGLFYSPSYACTPGVPIAITAGRAGLGNTGGAGTSGGGSSFGTLAADGGGGGGLGTSGSGANLTAAAGLPGGSGGGAGSVTGGSPYGAGGAASGVGTGHDGGSSYGITINGNTRAGGGGGGANAAGTNGTPTNGGDGGDGLSYAGQIGTTAVGDVGAFGGGGGGALNTSSSALILGLAGYGGGGVGGSTNSASGAGVATSGGGGGAGASSFSLGANGGDGIVVVNWKEDVNVGMGMVFN